MARWDYTEKFFCFISLCQLPFWLFAASGHFWLTNIWLLRLLCCLAILHLETLSWIMFRGKLSFGPVTPTPHLYVHLRWFSWPYRHIFSQLLHVYYSCLDVIYNELNLNTRSNRVNITSIFYRIYRYMCYTKLKSWMCR